jgi:hypothetical protein
MKRFLLTVATVGLFACATARPILYGNEKYKQVGSAGAARDVAECRRLAEEAGATPGAGRTGQAAKSAGAGAVGGAAAGAVGGAIGGSPGLGAAVGAASGVVWSLFSSLFGWMGPSRPSDVHMNYVNQCLADRGYQVAGWK